ncbi:MAG TPA: transglycosylase domain-containing protein, partial [Thermoleophilaceae bacterium]|nr:transglycosylase domain-containing protein [Thermoleophilaceae bacterium]
MSDDPLADIHEFPRTRPRVKKLRLLLVLSGLGLLALVSTAFGMMMALAADLDELETKADIREGRNSILVDVHGRRLGVLRSPENRILVEYEDIAEVMKHAVIAIEDKRFYEHEGVDLRGVARAFVQDVLQRKAVQGASTIPQQLVKNRLKAQSERTIFQKVRESALAYHLSRKWTKKKILTEYLNAIYFGNGAYGIESAARTYFGQEPHHQGCGESEKRPCAAELKAEEAALLAGIIASPSAYDPVSRPRAAVDRRNLVLRRMMEQQYITTAQYSDLVGLAPPAPDQVQPPREDAKTSAVPYFTTWVKQQVVDRYGPRDAFTGGLKIRTTIDLEMQRKAEETVQRWLGNPDGPTAALVAIDNRTGEVRAMVGGRDYNESPFNLATQGQRQPGSAFKPFTLATALREGIGPGSVWSSRKLTIHSKQYGCDFEVNNYEDAYSGVTTLQSATTFSDNAVYAQVGLRVGLGDIARTAERMGIRTPVSRNCAMTLGGLKEGVTPLDMAHAYQTFATGGVKVTGSLGPEGGPVGIRSVCRMHSRSEDCKGDGDENDVEKERVLSQGVADQVRSMLSTVVTSGTARRARLAQFAAGKTGTTENYGDAWFVGFTDKMTVAVWVGYPDELVPMTTEYAGQPVAGGTYPADIWRDFMVAATALLEEREAREGGGDEDVTTTPLPAGTPTEPGPAAPAEAEPPAPTGGGDPRPEQPKAPESPGTPPERPQEAA